MNVIAEKSGCDVVEASALVKHVINSCPNLTFMGIMTIGRFGYDITNGPNPDFICLLKCRETICNELEIDIKNIELSMGMSNDYEHAVGPQMLYCICLYINLTVVSYCRLNLVVQM